jgi:predicted nucleic acid-binding protein
MLSPSTFSFRYDSVQLLRAEVHADECRACSKFDSLGRRKVLDDIRGLRIRLLGDRSLQDHAWRIAAKLNWPDTYQAEYIALTQLQALATADRKLAAAARAFVKPCPRLTSCGREVTPLATSQSLGHCLSGGIRRDRIWRVYQ